MYLTLPPMYIKFVIAFCKRGVQKQTNFPILHKPFSKKRDTCMYAKIIQVVAMEAGTMGGMMEMGLGDYPG